MSEFTGNSISNRSLDMLVGEYDTSEMTVKNVNGGYSRNRRAIVSLGESEVFLKEVDTDILPDDGDVELGWLKKEHNVIEAVRPFVPSLLPEWSKLTMDGHLLIMPSYSTEDGWLWTPPEGTIARAAYVDRIVRATRELEEVQLPGSLTNSLSLQPYFRDKLANDDSIDRILSDSQLRSRLIEKYSSLLHEAGDEHLLNAYSLLINALKDDAMLEELNEKTRQLARQPNDCFNHCDVRSDNITYHPATDEVKFVDWNWASYAPSKFGSTEFLADMARRGVDITPWTSDLNSELLAAMVGLYIVKSLNEPLSPTSTLRQMQAETGAVSFQLYTLVR